MNEEKIISPTKVALMVVYNHRFDKNIPIVERLYKARFSHIYHLVPFYDAHIVDANVIPVYGCSHYFQGYISQAYTHLKHVGFTHFFIIADDLILNPRLNEQNLWEQIGIQQGDCFLPTELIVLQTLNRFWHHFIDAMRYKPRKKGLEANTVLPSVEQARSIFQSYRIPTGPISFSTLFSSWKMLRNLLRKRIFHRHLSYPLVGGYSDTFIMPAKYMEKFCTLCGFFSATDLFVELAIPTAMVLTNAPIKFNSDAKLHNGAYWGKGATYWKNPISEIESYGNNLNHLLKEFPADKFFVHPVKLSKWEWKAYQD
ncbi:MAG: hypothetical protein IJ786_02650 [Bacteroidaceae bacterium]|nr:hypothetical protein [Bacteroidaceae bacterium]